MNKTFKYQFSSWTKSIAKNAEVDWTRQLRILNDIAELITSQLSLEEIIAVIYENVNQLMDAYQFAIGIYDETEGLIHYKGMIENGKRLPDFSFTALDDGRLASWCIRNEQDIFMNDFDREYSNYLPVKPAPMAGIQPKAALYTPLKLNNKIAGLIRTKEWRWNDIEQLPAKSKNQLSMLTVREKDVLFLLVTGLPNKTIAEKLFVSADTIKTHTLNIYRKMEVGNRSSAMLKAVEWGWIH